MVASARCHIKGCGGAGGARGHTMTDRHVRAVRMLGQVRDSGRLARAPMPRDPYGRTRDWDAEEREHRAVRFAAEATERHLLMVATLPDEPVTTTIAGVDYVSLGEAARRLGIKPDTLLKAVHRGRLNARKVGRDWLVEESEIEWYRMRSLGRVGYPKGRPRKSAA